MAEHKRQCRACGKIKPLEEYGLNKDCREGREGTCRVCRKMKNLQNEMKKARTLGQNEIAEVVLPSTVGIFQPQDSNQWATNYDVAVQAQAAEESIQPHAVVEANSLTTTQSRGPKDAKGKTNWAVFPFKEAAAVVDVFEYGAKKYGRPFSYRDGIPVAELLSAIFRHAIEIQNGNMIDDESGLPHAAHISAGGFMLLSQVQGGNSKCSMRS